MPILILIRNLTISSSYNRARIPGIKRHKLELALLCGSLDHIITDMVLARKLLNPRNKLVKPRHCPEILRGSIDPLSESGNKNQIGFSVVANPKGNSLLKFSMMRGMVNQRFKSLYEFLWVDIRQVLYRILLDWLLQRTQSMKGFIGRALDLSWERNLGWIPCMSANASEAPHYSSEGSGNRGARRHVVVKRKEALAKKL